MSRKKVLHLLLQSFPAGTVMADSAAVVFFWSTNATEIREAAKTELDDLDQRNLLQP